MSIVRSLDPDSSPAGERGRLGRAKASPEGLAGCLAGVVLPEQRARTGRPLRVLCWTRSTDTEILRRSLDGDTVGVLHAPRPLSEDGAGDHGGAGQGRSEDRPLSRFLTADPLAERSGIAPGCYDLVLWDGFLGDVPRESAPEIVGKLRRFLRGNGILALPGLGEHTCAALVEGHGLEPMPLPVARDVFRAEGPTPPRRLEDLLGRRVVAICGMPRAGTTFLCDAVRTYGSLHGLFITPRFWRSPIKLEEGACLNAINDDPRSTAVDFVEFMQEAAAWYRVPSDMGLVCKLPQMVWRPDLLRSFSTVVTTVRPLDGWLDSAIRYRDTVMHAAGPAAWLPEPVQNHIREHFDGDFLREYGRCTRDQVRQVDDVLDVERAVFDYGDRESMQRALQCIGLPGEQVLAETWHGSRW